MLVQLMRRMLSLSSCCTSHVKWSLSSIITVKTIAGFLRGMANTPDICYQSRCPQPCSKASHRMRAYPMSTQHLCSTERRPLQSVPQNFLLAWHIYRLAVSAMSISVSSVSKVIVCHIVCIVLDGNEDVSRVDQVSIIRIPCSYTSHPSRKQWREEVKLRSS